MTQKALEKISGPLVTGEMQIKTTVKYRLTPTRLVIIKQQNKSKTDPGKYW
jgi:hypothetical protein